MTSLFRSARRRTLITWPEAVDARLDALVDAAAAVGEVVNRSQLLAALVSQAPTHDETLVDLIRLYRRIDLEEFAVPERRSSSVRPGRRRRSSQAL